MFYASLRGAWSEGGEKLDTERYKAMDRRVVDEIINGGNLDVADELFAPEYVYHGPGGQELRGPEGFKQLITVYRTAFPDIELTVKDMIAEGDRLAVRFTIHGTHEGDLMGIPPTGKKISITGNIVYRIEDGMFVESWETFEQMTMMQQLGVLPPP